MRGSGLACGLRAIRDGSDMEAVSKFHVLQFLFALHGCHCSQVRGMTKFYANRIGMFTITTDTAIRDL